MGIHTRISVFLLLPSSTTTKSRLKISPCCMHRLSIVHHDWFLQSTVKRLHLLVLEQIQHLCPTRNIGYSPLLTNLVIRGARSEGVNFHFFDYKALRGVISKRWNRLATKPATKTRRLSPQRHVRHQSDGKGVGPFKLLWLSREWLPCYFEGFLLPGTWYVIFGFAIYTAAIFCFCFIFSTHQFIFSPFPP